MDMELNLDFPAAEPPATVPVRKVNVAVELPAISWEKRKEYVLCDDLEDDPDIADVSSCSLG